MGCSRKEGELWTHQQCQRPGRIEETEETLRNCHWHVLAWHPDMVQVLLSCKYYYKYQQTSCLKTIYKSNCCFLTLWFTIKGVNYSIISWLGDLPVLLLDYKNVDII